ncbi:MAG: hypothetical protein ACOCQX_01495 [Candidatus Nanoarchaeia archaeon]
MFGKDLTQEIIALYDSNLLNVFSINEISKKLGKKYPYVNKKVSSLIGENILKKIVVGRSYLCSLNLENEKTILLLCLNEINKQPSHAGKVKQFIRRQRLESSIHSVVELQGRLIFILNELKPRRKIERYFENSTALDRDEFIDMLIENPGLFKNHTVVYGYERFFELITTSADELKRVYSPINY